MPRTARQRSESGIYHIMLRGANRQEIFRDDEDCLGSWGAFNLSEENVTNKPN